MVDIATFTDIKGNLGVKLIITETSQNIANNTTTISYSARVYKTGTHNPWNHYTQTPFKLVINGETIYNQNANYDLRDWTSASRLSRTEQIITSGTRTITHNTNGSKSISVSWSANFTSTGAGYGYGAVLASDTMTLTDIPRVSKATLSKANFNFGETVALTTNRASTNFTHTVSYIAGSSEVSLATSVGASTSIAIPMSRINSIPNASSESMKIRVKTFNGKNEIGSHDISITVNVPTTVAPKVDGVTLSETVSEANIFSSNNDNYIRGISKVKATAINARGEYGSAIVLYEFRLKEDTSYNGASTSNNFTFGAFNVPSSGSALYRIQCRVQDSRGRYSAWIDSTQVRFHYYAQPTISTPGLSRNDTVLSVERSYSVQPIMENGIERNTGSLSFQTRPKGSSSWAANGGAKYTGMSLSKSSSPLSGIFLDNVAYEVQGILSDKLNTIYSGIAVSGSDFVTLEVLLGTGIGVGKSPIAGNGDLQVGSGGINSEGPLNTTDSITGLAINSNGSIRSNGITIEQGRHFNFKSFTVGGTANNYYPVIISPQATFGFHRYSISRGYNWTAPNTWNTSTHRGGLTLDFEWSGDTNWGGNDKTVRVIEWNETYSTIVGGLKLAHSGGLIVWLRGGGAEYRLTSERGMYAGIEVALSGFTDASGESFPARSSPVTSEINNSYPVRGTGALYEYGHRVITTNTISNHAAVVTTGNNANGNWYQVGSGLLICSQNFSFANKFSDYTLTGSWTFPKAFSSAPSVSATGRTSAGLGDNQEIMNGTLNQVGNTSTTGVDFSWHKFSGDHFGTSSRKYLTVFAIGFP